MKSSRKRDGAPETTIVQLVPAEGWHAIYIDDREEHVRPLVAFSLVEARFSGQRPFRCVRPMCSCEHGLIEDVQYFPGFVRLVPPGDIDYLLDGHEHGGTCVEHEEVA